MSDILLVKIYHKDELIFTCNYLHLKRCSSSLSREIDFHNVRNLAKAKLEHGEKLVVEVSFNNKYGSKLFMSEFKIILDNFSDLLSGAPFSVSGIITLDGPYYHDYNQDIADIYNKWQSNEIVNYWTMDSNQKENYLSCCANWSGLLQEIKQVEYQLDCSRISDETDFYYLLGLTFAGERGYFGSSIYTLEDCLIEVRKKNEVMPSLTLVNAKTFIKNLGETHTAILSSLREFGVIVHIT